MPRRLLTLIAGLLSVGLFSGIVAVAPASADVTDPGDTIVPNSAWFEGGLVNNWGLNCSTAIIGSAYSEPMTQAAGLFGGDSLGGVPRVNQTYYLGIRLSEPGFPCGVGASVPEIRLRLPKNTSLAIDQAHPVRCFGTRRFQNSYIELTNGGDWYIDLPSGGRVTGPWCQSQPRLLGDGSYSVGTPALANGVFQMIFVPVRSSTPLVGEPMSWEIHDPSTYEGAVSSRSLVYVFNTNTSGPTFFVPDKAATSFWNTKAPAGEENQLEVLMNLYPGRLSGTLCFKVLTASNQTYWDACKDAPPGGWNSYVDGNWGLVKVYGTQNPGPNGGYAPIYFPKADYGKDFTVQWTFKSGQTTYSSPKIPVRSLSGPDNDGDGVVDSQDKCPATAGTAGNAGCPPSTPVDTDGDGVVGVADKCPQADGKGALDGCPAATTDPTPAPGPQKTQALPKSLRKAKNVKSSTPSVCTVTGKGSKARVVVKKAGTCILKGRKGKKTVKAKFKVS